MALPVIANVYRCAFNWSAPSGGQHATNVMHFATTTTDEDGIAALLESNSDPSMFGQMVDGASVDELVIQKLDGVSAARSYDLSGTWVGANAGSDTWTPGGALVLTLKTPFAGRSARGRVYLPFIDESAQTNGFLVADASLIAAAWNDFKDAMIADTCFWSVASYLLADAHSVTNVVVNQALGTQRRRQTRLR